MILDLGGTLADYYERAEARAVGVECVKSALAWLRARGALAVELDAAWRGWEAEAREAEDFRVRPLEARLVRAWWPGRAPAPEVLAGCLEAFLAPVFARGRLVPGARDLLDRLARRGLKVAVLSNMPWGSPRGPWEGELRRLGLADLLPVFWTCRDAGWRKPAPPAFAFVRGRLGVAPEHCLFVGDEPVWDYAGALAAGLQAVLFDRDGRHDGPARSVIRSLAELEGRL